jgi:hypothetical protein
MRRRAMWWVLLYLGVRRIKIVSSSIFGGEKAKLKKAIF